MKGRSGRTIVVEREGSPCWRRDLEGVKCAWSTKGHGVVIRGLVVAIYELDQGRPVACQRSYHTARVQSVRIRDPPRSAERQCRH
jgi:hypothetical protein